MSVGTKIKDGILTVIVVAVIIGFLALAAVRTADLYFKAGWIVSHFPPKGNLCTELFCVRTDTTKPEWKFLQVHFAYCPDHLPSGFQGRGARSVGVLVYLSIVMILLSFLTAPILGALFRVAAWPILIPMRLAGKLPPGHLLPFARYGTHTEAPGDWLEPAGMVVGAVVAVASIFLYCWW
jgi:hypothetical protein